MPGELAAIHGALLTNYQTLHPFLGRVKGYLRDPREVSTSTQAVYFQYIADEYVESVELIYTMSQAVQWLIDHGTWFNDMEINDLITILRGDVSALAVKIASDVSNNASFIINKVDEISSDVRSLLFPEFSYLDSLIRQEISNLNYILTKSITDTKTTITDQIGSQITDISRDVDSLENTVTESHNRTVSQLDDELKNSQRIITTSIDTSENRIQEGIGVATGFLSQGIIAAQLAVENTFIDTMEKLKKAFVSLADDIAKRIWEYFRDFVFEKV